MSPDRANSSRTSDDTRAAVAARDIDDVVRIGRSAGTTDRVRAAFANHIAAVGSIVDAAQG